MSRLQLRLILIAIVAVVSLISSMFQTEPDRRPQTPTDPVEVSLEQPTSDTTVAKPTSETKPSTEITPPSKSSDLVALNRGVLRGPEEVAIVQHIIDHGSLPDSFVTKREAEKLGWDASEGNLRKVAPGKSIGGDRFYNREGELPEASGRKYYEADLNYNGGHRGAERLVYSSDGLIYVTRNHYRSFQQVKTK